MIGGNFSRTRVYEAAPAARAAGRDRRLAGWRLTYTNTSVSPLLKRAGRPQEMDMNYSTGLLLKEDGYVIDVVPGCPSDRGGWRRGRRCWR